MASYRSRAFSVGLAKMFSGHLRAYIAQEGHTPTLYALEDFARTEYRDPVVPVQILLILMGFTVALMNELFKAQKADLIFYTGMLCGIIYLLYFMFYLTEYYDRLWEPFYLLPEDKMYCRIYSLGIGLVVLSLMPNWPEFWAAYVLAMFAALYWMKVRTRHLFRGAVEAKYGRVEWCYDPHVRAKLMLSEAFTRNFLVWGLGLFIPFAAVMIVSAAACRLVDAEDLENGLGVSQESFQAAYMAASIVITAITVIFWSKKITKGLAEMRRMIDAGNYQYFSDMMP